MSRTHRLLIAATALSAAGLGLWVWNRLEAPPAPPPAIGGFVFPEPRKLPPVELVDDRAEAFAPSQFAGSWSFVYFGYTYCPDVCPLALLELAALKERLATALPDARAAYFLVSVDPARDTPARLREYVRYFDPAFRGLTGSPEAVAALAKATETIYFVPEGQGTEGYLVSHSNNIVLLDPSGELAAIFTPPHSPEQLAADFAAILAHRSSRR